MPAARNGKLERQRERIRALVDADPGRSSHSIAVELGCSTHTVIRQRNLHVSEHTADCTANGTAHPGSENLLEPAGAGNGRALKHGAYAAGTLAPRVEELTAELRKVVPTYQPSDDAAVKMLALLLAQVEAVNGWLEERGMFKNVARGELQPVLAAQGRWINAAARLCDQLGLTPTARARLGVARDGGDGYAEYLRLTSGKGSANGN